jgi:hypothetical protein
VDHADHPASALIWLPRGYPYLVGEPGEAPSLESLAHLLVETLAPAWQAALLIGASALFRFGLRRYASASS